MLFDWVDVFPDYCQVLSIQKNGKIYTSSGVRCAADHIKGIEITQEILEANGFRKRGHIDRFYHVIYCNDSPIYLEPKINGYWEYWEMSPKSNEIVEIQIKYVHELQHILRLQGYYELSLFFKIK